jgi:long-chain acyl-CoA synthetase
MIPLYDTLGIDTIPFVLNQSEIATIFCSAPSVLTLLKCGDLGKLEYVVTLDDLTQETIEQCKQRGLKVFSF